MKHLIFVFMLLTSTIKAQTVTVNQCVTVTDDCGIKFLATPFSHSDLGSDQEYENFFPCMEDSEYFLTENECITDGSTDCWKLYITWNTGKVFFIRDGKIVWCDWCKADSIDFKTENYTIDNIEVYDQEGCNLDVEYIENLFEDMSELPDSNFFLMMNRYKQLVKKLSVGVYTTVLEKTDTYIVERTNYVYYDAATKQHYIIIDRNKIIVPFSLNLR